MAEYYLQSNNIYVFPCANRGIVDAGKFTTEFNLRMLAKASSTNQVIRSTGLCVECFVDGYYIAIDLAQLVTNNLDALKGKQVYLKLNIVEPASTPTPTWMQLHSNIQHQRRLMPFDTSTTTVLDDTNGRFIGAKITIESAGAFSLGTINSTGSGWV